MKLSKLLLAPILNLLVLAVASSCSAPASPWPPSPVSHRTVNQDGVQYYLSPSFVLTAQNTKTKKVLWTVSYKPFSSSETTQAELTLQIDHGTLYASDNYGMVAFNSATGHQKWRSSYRYPVFGSPIFQEGVIAIPYLSSGAYTTGGLEAYSIRTGRFLWQALGINYDKPIVHRKGYLICYLAPFMVQELPPNAKCYVNILTGNKTYPK